MFPMLSRSFNARSLIPGALSAAMFLSLVCSLSIQADMPIAETAKDGKPLQVGQSAPQFVVRTVDNEAFSFDPQDLERPVMLVTFRGGWCPYCNMHLSELRNVIPEIDALGVDVLFLSGDRPELLYQSLKRETQEDIDGLDYQILSDADSTAAIALGISFKASEMLISAMKKRGADLADSSMSLSGSLPVPSVFAIDTDGVIAFAYVNADYKVRLPADELLDVARSLSE
jgi:peroxiredoxin